jgi:hypothetical protein
VPRYGAADHTESGNSITAPEAGTGFMRPNVAFGASNAPNVAFGASDATNATLGRMGTPRRQPLAAMSASTAAIDRTGTPVPPLPV